MVRHIGVSGFGFFDSVSDLSVEQPDNILIPYVADAILPKTYSGEILVGEEAESGRINSGLYWPPEASVSPDIPLRRVPISYLWKLLVQARDSRAYYRTSKHQFKVSEIIVKHIINLVKESNLNSDKNDELIIPIPDSLDEYGQEELLREFAKYGYTNIRLLWRSIAAAIEWGSCFEKIEQIKEDGDWILIVYLGLDGINLIPLDLKKDKYRHKEYVVPVRRRDHVNTGLSYSDMLGCFAEKFCCINSNDYNAFWQLYTQFPELPSIIKGIDPDKSELPRIWSTCEGWKLWKSVPEDIDDVYNMNISESNMLNQLFSERANIGFRANNKSWGDYIYEKIVEVIEHKSRLNLKDIVFCGAFAPVKKAAWISRLSETYKHVNISLGSVDSSMIASGASIYGVRKSNGEPTFYDTLPRLSMLTIRNREHHWQDIIESKVYEGGEEYTNRIPDAFAINKDASSLDIYLQKEFAVNNDEEGCLNNSPYRKNIVDFGVVTNKNIPVIMDVSFKPASGLAKIRITPQDRSFRNGRSEVFNFDKMEKISEDNLPEQRIGYPDIIDRWLYADINRNIYSTLKHECRDLLASNSILSCQRLLKKVSNSLAGAISLDSRKEFCTDSYGLTNDMKLNELLNEISERLEQELTNKSYSDAKMDSVVAFMVEFKGLIPFNLYEYITNYFDDATNNINNPVYKLKYWQSFCKYSSKVIHSEDDYYWYFECIRFRIEIYLKLPFPMYAMQEITRILMEREDGWRGLTRELAVIFINAGLAVMKQQLANENPLDLFLSSAKLFLALLRFRKSEPDFLDPDVPKYKVLFDQVEQAMTEGAELVAIESPNQKKRIEDVRDMIISYMKHEGTRGLPQLLLKYD